MNRSSSLSQTAEIPEAKPAARQDAPASKRQILWIDGVGGYLMIGRDDVLIGQAGGMVDIAIAGDVSRQSAVLRRRGSDYFIDPLQETRVESELISQATLLPSEAHLQLGGRVRLRLVKPHPLSSTARLELTSLHRFQPRVDGILLLADSCILGPGSSCHVRCSQWEQDLLMFRQENQWYLRVQQAVEVNGQSLHQPQGNLVAITDGLRLRAADFSLSVESF